MKTFIRITETKEHKKVINCEHCGAARFEYRDGIKVCSYCGCETEETSFVNPNIIHKTPWGLTADEWLLHHSFKSV